MFKKSPIILILLIVIVVMAAGGLTSYNEVDKSDRHHEGEWRGPWSMMGTGGFWMFPFFPIIILVVILYFVFGKNSAHRFGFDSDDTPMQILKKRYAKGEITKEEYDEIKKDL